MNNVAVGALGMMPAHPATTKDCGACHADGAAEAVTTKNIGHSVKLRQHNTGCIIAILF